MHPNTILSDGTKIVWYTLLNSIEFILVLISIFVCGLFIKSAPKSGWIDLLDKSTQRQRKTYRFTFYISKYAFVFYNAILLVLTYVTFDIMAGNSDFFSNREYFTEANYLEVLYYIPVTGIPFAILLGFDPRKALDYLTPFAALDLALGKIPCFFAGCCSGIEMANGLYNNNTGRFEFPVQLVEVGVGLLVFVFFVFYVFKLKKSDGKAMPLYFIIYGITRFAIEFLRGDIETRWMGLRPFQVLSLIAFLIGLLWLGVIVLLEKLNKRPLLNKNIVDVIMMIKHRKEKKQNGQV